MDHRFVQGLQAGVRSDVTEQFAGEAAGVGVAFPEEAERGGFGGGAEVPEDFGGESGGGTGLQDAGDFEGCRERGRGIRQAGNAGSPCASGGQLGQGTPGAAVKHRGARIAAGRRPLVIDEDLAVKGQLLRGALREGFEEERTQPAEGGRASDPDPGLPNHPPPGIDCDLGAVRDKDGAGSRRPR